MIRQYIALGGLTVIAMAMSATVGATTLTVSPTRIDLGTDGAATTVKVKNTDNNATTIQVLARPWVKGAKEIDPASEIFAVPPIFDLPAGEEQIIRVAARGLTEETAEKAFLFYIKEVPREVQTSGSNVSFALNIELPLFVTPDAAEPEPIWKVSTSSEGEPSLNLMNAGNAHFRVDEFKITKLEGEELLGEEKNGSYILAGKKKNWPLDIDLNGLSDSIILQANTSLGPIETILALPDR